jgi:hypothetical protein
VSAVAFEFGVAFAFVAAVVRPPALAIELVVVFEFVAAACFFLGGRN